MNSQADDKQIMNYLVRMVIPMRREFGQSLDIAHFMRDSAYAESVLAEAVKSQDTRLVAYAKYLQTRHNGPRHSEPAVVKESLAMPIETRPVDDPAQGTPAAAPSRSMADDMKARIMKKYTDGLR